MPEQLTKHPEVTLEVLRSAGARCGEGAPQAILTQCPPNRFCKLPGGEICVYGLDEAPRMTQISAADWRALQQALQLDVRPRESEFGDQSLLIGAGVLLGVALGAIATHLARRKS
ncbi:MAG: hypothetical protein ACM3SS_04980 [Rhodospirillaceae bacterium]